ncbi:Nop52-domain-containing protein [Ramicandelaber brevisporus]|nr:Nop52-domain-containing protein [Ramicandelaber brevisporus]
MPEQDQQQKQQQQQQQQSIPKLPAKLGHRLAFTEKADRDSAVADLTAWFSASYASPSASIDHDQLLKLWKGLFYNVWMSDKPLVQQQLVADLASIAPKMPLRPALAFLGSFWETMAIEWVGLDRLRLDKYLLLMRRCVYNGLVVLHQNGWSKEAIEMHTQMLMEKGRGILEIVHGATKIPSGVPCQLADVFTEELARLLEKPLAKLDLGEHQVPEEFPLVELLEPFTQVMEASTNNQIRESVYDGVFEGLLSHIVRTESIIENKEQSPLYTVYKQVPAIGSVMFTRILDGPAMNSKRRKFVLDLLESYENAVPEFAKIMKDKREEEFRSRNPLLKNKESEKQVKAGKKRKHEEVSNKLDLLPKAKQQPQPQKQQQKQQKQSEITATPVKSAESKAQNGNGSNGGGGGNGGIDGVLVGADLWETTPSKTKKASDSTDNNNNSNKNKNKNKTDEADADIAESHGFVTAKSPSKPSADKINKRDKAAAEAAGFTVSATSDSTAESTDVVSKKNSKDAADAAIPAADSATELVTPSKPSGSKSQTQTPGSANSARHVQFKMDRNEVKLFKKVLPPSPGFELPATLPNLRPDKPVLRSAPSQPDASPASPSNDAKDANKKKSAKGDKKSQKQQQQQKKQQDEDLDEDDMELLTVQNTELNGRLTKEGLQVLERVLTRGEKKRAAAKQAAKRIRRS